jgi:hypothetical protein
LYARFFGGELEVVSVYPAGCDVFVTLGSIVDETAAEAMAGRQETAVA